ncbi:DUF3808 domain-containing protein [Hymenobacter busanensis]|uniref:DUF3808 domain-containing protein n=1 Tax=Hymenobacter busanensis TaxID=2607656 RepID=A0A7L4ZXT4_9BACT|nr:DUF3808 domain-containing protein [Hymenobacter busanensis]KAA9325910.1 DUF3808 domain-containing protein [Hymenobacter busanensis]QHJ06250.1 DUF3808 domain-containing protein [Hymenobacter busanensis]
MPRVVLLVAALAVFGRTYASNSSSRFQSESDLASASADALSTASRRAYAELLKLRTGAARALVRAELRQTPHNPGALLVDEGVGFTELVVSQDATRYDAVIEQQDDYLEQLDALPHSALRDYARAEIRLHQAAAQVMFGHEFQGAWSLRQAYLQVQQNARRWPAHLPTRKTLGLCQFLIGSVPEGYRWFLNLLGLPGDTNAGQQNLRAAALRPHDFQTEAQILLALTRQTYYGADDEAATLADRLVREQPDNLLFSYLSMSVQKKLHRADRALAAYRSRPTGPTYFPVAYLHHMAADLLLYQGQYPASAQANQLFLNEYRGVHYRKDAWFKLYLAHWLGGDATAAQRARQQIVAGGETVVEEDRYAQRFVDDAVPLNRALTTARLQLDGGYYRQALVTLDGFNATAATPLRDRLEEPYRRARAHHGLGRLDSARLYYQRTIALSGSAPYYFAPQSALQLGYICLEAGQKAQAKVYFQKALSYSKHEYKTSTDAKAKVALAALK